MAKFLLHGSYSAEGNKGIISGGGGTARRKVVSAMVEGLGGKLEAFYWALGKDDFYLIVDLPSIVSVAAVAMQVGASGSISRLGSIQLLTAEEVDAASKVAVKYTPPGR